MFLCVPISYLYNLKKKNYILDPNDANELNFDYEYNEELNNVINNSNETLVYDDIVVTLGIISTK